MTLVAIEIIGVMLLLTQMLFLVILWSTNFRGYPAKIREEWPKVTLLMVARNESRVMQACLLAFEKIDYPAEKLEIILADDHSEDDTGVILKQWAEGRNHVKVIAIDAFIPNETVNGKANALAQMIPCATGKYLIFTDADCIVPSTWVKSMVNAAEVDGDDKVRKSFKYRKSRGLVTGITQVGGAGLMAKMQNLDWLFTLGMVKVLSDTGQQVTTMGNNMLISKEAYMQVGGFGEVGFSMTEDFQIAKAIHRKGFEAVHLVSQENMVTTQPESNMSGLLMQRKRWMYGAMRLPLKLKVLLALQALFLPLVVLLLINYVFLGWLFWLTKWCLQSFFIILIQKKLGQNISLINLIFFEIYYLFTAWATIVCYFWPSNTTWKGRKY
ncbi:glycosyltransferase [Belliella kenyensis]|uniref:Glycosyltransferase n=1 Tax=Belliella kenyensis TaxID=1472724 RepID=A0ABV8ELF7_9BACT|nr:glycosyltransferase [Belliella kenyensis]MCH7400731.1 glycosyltransferase [Belliella kenyensis]MDN3601982.1 glycosyltransferase [Belliella kenyensis]